MSDIPEKVLQADKERHYEEYKFLNFVRKLKKRLREETGARPQPMLDPAMMWPNPPAERCGDCQGCLEVKCRMCVNCLAMGVTTRRTTEPALCCGAPSRRCEKWLPPATPAMSASSIVSDVNADSIRIHTQKMEDQMDKLGKSTYDLIVEIKNAGGGPWGERNDLSETTLKQWLELQQEQVELVERSISRQREINLIDSLRDEGSEPEIVGGSHPNVRPTTELLPGQGSLEVPGGSSYFSTYARQLAATENQGEFAKQLSEALKELQPERSGSTRTSVAVSVVRRTPQAPSNSLGSSTASTVWPLNQRGGRQTGFTPSPRRSRSEGRGLGLEEGQSQQRGETGSVSLARTGSRGEGGRRSSLFQYGEGSQPVVQQNVSQENFRSLMPPPGGLAGRMRTGAGTRSQARHEGQEDATRVQAIPLITQNTARLTRRRNTFNQDLEHICKRVEEVEKREVSHRQLGGMETELRDLRNQLEEIMSDYDKVMKHEERRKDYVEQKILAHTGAANQVEQRT